ncbi:MAG: hypothetical protein Q9M10_04435 [Mariprofundaceae bacterium]|nr:hypothetical protein [Mariprofundaceae bacterium]
MIKKIGVTIAFFGAINVATAQEDQSLTLFTLGVESVQYSEDTGGGITASGKSMTNLTQRSSGYTAVNDHFGFYITTISTLSANQTQESWSISNYGTVQANQRKVMLTDLELSAAWEIFDQHFDGLQLLAGLNLNRMSFSRSGFIYSQGVQGAATIQANNVIPGTFAKNPNGPLQQLTNPNGNTTYLSRQNGAVFEDSTTLLAEIGINYDSFFSDATGIRLLGGIRAGIPLYYYVTNSNYPNTSWTSSFQGFNLHANVGVGFQLKDNFDFVVMGSSDYRFRAKTSVDAATGGVVPNVKATIFRATAGLSWSF